MLSTKTVLNKCTNCVLPKKITRVRFDIVCYLFFFSLLYCFLSILICLFLHFFIFNSLFHSILLSIISIFFFLLFLNSLYVFVFFSVFLFRTFYSFFLFCLSGSSFFPELYFFSFCRYL